MEILAQIGLALALVLLAAIASRPYLDRALFAAALSRGARHPNIERSTTAIFDHVSSSVVQVVVIAGVAIEGELMSQTKIAVILGNLRRDSFNAKLALALAIAELAPPEFTLTRSRIDDLPLYNQDDDANQADQVKRLKAEIAGAHGLLFVTPEYNRSVPGFLKNAIDHASRPYGQSVFAGKPAGVIGVSIGAIGTPIGQAI
jgi:hypothetical protein